MRALPVSLLLAGCLLAKDPIVDEVVRLKALSTIFPDAEIEAVERRIDSTLRLDLRPPLVFPDALAPSPAYRVPGDPRGEAELCAAEDQVMRTASKEREVRLRLFPWPGAVHGELLAVLQYRFVNAKPPAACPTLAELFRISTPAKGWSVTDRFPLDSNRHNHIEGLQFLDLTGEPEPELVIESDSGDGSRFQSDLHILMLQHGRFQELLNVPSRFHLNVQGDQWTQTIDAESTREHHGDQFCFDKIVWAADHRRFAAPVVTHPCYSRGTGVLPGK